MKHSEQKNNELEILPINLTREELKRFTKAVKSYEAQKTQKLIDETIDLVIEIIALSSGYNLY